MIWQYIFPAEIRLKSRKQIEALFQTPQSYFKHPILLKYLKTDIPVTLESRNYPIQVVVTVPKRSFPRAVDRNLLKRRIRESIRLHWQSCLPEQKIEQQRHLMFIYVAKEILAYQPIETAVIQGLKEALA